jgi:hypothetical protein
MKRVLMFAACFLIFAGAISGAPISNVTSSAWMPGDSAIVNLDFIDPYGLSLYDVIVKAKPSGATADSTIMLSHMPADPYYLTTFGGTMHFANPGSPIQYYARIAADTLVATQSYKNTANQFPPAANLYADLAPDAVGDTMAGTPGQWLDLTGAAMTYSDTRLYGRLSNVGGGWPNSQGLTTYYIYGLLLLNPDSLLNLSVTAMVMVNVPILFPAGLYTLNLSDTSFTRIAGISHQAVGNNLNLACDLSDLTSSPNFPVWPPQAGYVLVVGFTATVSITGGTPSFNDYTYPSMYIPETQTLNVTGNHIPAISDIAFDMVPNIAVNVRCNYFDADNNLPVTKQLYFDNAPYSMGALDHNYVDSAMFNHGLVWPGEGPHAYYFRFSDGASVIQTPVDTVYVTASGLTETQMPSDFKLSQNYPNPFNGRTKIEFSLSKRSDVELAVFDVIGNKVAILTNDRLEAGSHSVIWDGNNIYGHPVSSGVYFYKLDINGQRSVSREMLLLK